MEPGTDAMGSDAVEAATPARGESPATAKRVILLGPPGAGKGTQAVVVAARLGVPHVSTGDIFRANVGGNTELGQQAKSYMDAGELVPDSLTNAMVAARLVGPDVAGGVLLDGFPRTVEQAAVLGELLSAASTQVDAAVELVVDTDELVSRLLKRAVDQGRADDTETVIRNRMDVYRRETAPLAAYYRERGLLRQVSGTGRVEQITAAVLAALSA